MKYYINKFIEVFNNKGLISSIFLVLKFPFNFVRLKVLERKIILSSSTEDRFSLIYRSNYWNNRESVSGEGSTFENTKNIRNELPKIIEKLDIKNIFDAPCGDFNWMSYLINDLNVNYLGGDIVPELINQLNSKHGTSKVSFTHINLIEDIIPKSDLLICRDCLFHFSYNDIEDFIINFLKSETPYILTTTHLNENNFVNKDIETGLFRCIDLYIDPFNFPLNPIAKINDWSPPYKKMLCLWSREQIIDSRIKT